MPLALIIIGSIFLIAGIRDTVTVTPTGPGLFPLLEGEFLGPNNFIYWFLAIVIIGAIGYVKSLKPISDAFLILVIVVLFLKKGSGFFDMFQKQIDASTTFKPQSNSSTPDWAALAAASASRLNTALPPIAVTIPPGTINPTTGKPI